MLFDAIMTNRNIGDGKNDSSGFFLPNPSNSPGLQRVRHIMEGKSDWNHPGRRLLVPLLE